MQNKVTECWQEEYSKWKHMKEMECTMLSVHESLGSLGWNGKHALGPHFGRLTILYASCYDQCGHLFFQHNPSFRSPYHVINHALHGANSVEEYNFCYKVELSHFKFVTNMTTLASSKAKLEQVEFQFRCISICQKTTEYLKDLLLPSKIQCCDLWGDLHLWKATAKTLWWIENQNYVINWMSKGCRWLEMCESKTWTSHYKHT